MCPRRTRDKTTKFSTHRYQWPAVWVIAWTGQPDGGTATLPDVDNSLRAPLDVCGTGEPHNERDRCMAHGWVDQYGGSPAGPLPATANRVRALHPPERMRRVPERILTELGLRVRPARTRTPSGDHRRALGEGGRHRPLVSRETQPGCGPGRRRLLQARQRAHVMTAPLAFRPGWSANSHTRIRTPAPHACTTTSTRTCLVGRCSQSRLTRGDGPASGFHTRRLLVPEACQRCLEATASELGS